MRLIDSVDAVIFDLDGTLLDTAEGIVKSIEYTISYFNYPMISKHKMLTFIGPPIRDSLKNEFNLTDSEADLATNVFRDRYKEHDLFSAKPYPDVFNLLKFISENGKGLGIATYKREDYAIKIAEHFRLTDYCTCIKGADSANVNTKKDILANCIEELAVDCRKVLYIGDSESDANAALSLNAKFIGVSYGYGFKLGETSSEFNILISLNEILKDLN